MDNITVKSSGNTIKLESTPEEVTGGYFDNQEVWHEFGGGGGDSLQPIVHVKYVNGGGADVNPVTPNITELFANYIISDNHVIFGDTIVHTVGVNEYNSFDMLFLAESNYETPPTYYSYMLIDNISPNTDYSGDSVRVYRFFSDGVNCTLDKEGGIIITDPTKEASFTITFKFGEDEFN